jgi:DNA-binding NarL/FixJ family response regulator
MNHAMQRIAGKLASSRTYNPQAHGLGNESERGHGIRVYLACDDSNYGHRLRKYLVDQAGIEVCGATAVNAGAVPESSVAVADIAILEVRSLDKLEFVDSLKKLAPRLPLFLVAGQVSFEGEKRALSHGVDAVFPKEDDPSALIRNARVICDGSAL